MLIYSRFEKALSIKAPWYINNITFDEKKKQLDIYIDFVKGTKFFYEDRDSGNKVNYPIYDTRMNTWRHLNFLSISAVYIVGHHIALMNQ